MAWIKTCCHKMFGDFSSENCFPTFGDFSSKSCFPIENLP